MDLQQKYPFVKEILATRGRKNKHNRASARNVVVDCPCCGKERITTNWALELHSRAGKSPSGWCRTCALTLRSHLDWIEILPALWRKHGNWTNLVIRRFSSTKRRAEIRNVKFELSVLELPAVPERCPIFDWVEFEAPTGKTSYSRGYRNFAPSIDRIKPELGYIKENIRWVSTRANALRSDASPAEMMALFLDSERLEENYD